MDSELSLMTFSAKSDAPDFAPPPPFIPLNPTTYTIQLPALLHAFFAARLEAGLGLEDDPAFDTAHSVIGSLGQVNIKPVAVVGGAKKKAPGATVSGPGIGEEKKKYVKKAP